MIGRHSGSRGLAAKFPRVFLEYRLQPGVVTQAMGGLMMNSIKAHASALPQSAKAILRIDQLQCIIDSMIGQSILW